MAEQNTTTQPVILQVPSTVKSLIEALIFGAREPLSVRQIQTLYEVQGSESGEPRKIDYDSIGRIIEELNSEYTAADRAYRIVQIAGGYQFATQPAYAEWLGKLYKEQARRKLSQSSIETLAIIAYKQPITKPEIESIRGVNCDYVLGTLLEKDLATIIGRAPTVGRPLLYGTTNEFLKHFGLNDLNDLPRPREIQEILGDGQFETERRMLEAEQDLLDEKKEEDFKSRLPHIPKRKSDMDDDVKIVPKKRSRELKVRQNEGATGKLTEEPKEDAQLTLVPEVGVAPAQTEVTDTMAPFDSAEQTSIPTSGKELEAPISGKEPAQETSDPAILAESLRYIDLARRPTEQGEIIEEAQPVSSEFIGDKPVEPEVVSEEVLAEADVTEESAVPESAEAATRFMEPQPEVLAPAEIMVPESLSVSESEQPDVDRPNDTATREIIDSQATVLPEALQPVAQLTVAREAESQPPDLGQMPEGLQDQPQDLKSKSRWTSWKEKIQGFIKKLFG